MKVLVVLITKDYVEPECLESVLKQDYPDYSWMISGMKPKFRHDFPWAQVYLNCSYNRNYARQMALASDAEAFLFVDSDIVLPSNAISSFVKQVCDAKPSSSIMTPPGMTVSSSEKHIIGGWYKVMNDTRYVAGRWVADNTFINFYIPEQSLVRTDVIGLGCAFITRKALIDIEFEHGIDIVAKYANGDDICLGECGAFGNRAAEKGYEMYMDGSVICEHIKREGRE